jgi:hypothetical protein
MSDVYVVDTGGPLTSTNLEPTKDSSGWINKINPKATEHAKLAAQLRKICGF